MKAGDRVIYHCTTGANYPGRLVQQISAEIWLVLLDSGDKRYVRCELLEKV